MKSELNTGRILPQNRQLPRSFAVGRSPDLKKQIAARLSQLAKDLELDEMVVVTWTYDPAPSHRSYELLAKAFGWAIKKRFSITGYAIEEREHQSGIRLINYLVTAIVSEPRFEIGRKLSSLIRMYVQPVRKSSAGERTGSICACRVVDLSAVRRLLLPRCP